MRMVTSKDNSKSQKLFRNLSLGCLALTGVVTFGSPHLGYAQDGAAKDSVAQNKKLAAPSKPAKASQNENLTAPVKKPQAAPDLSRAEFIKLMDIDFQKRDTDGNGKATRAEIEAHTRRTSTAKAQEQNRVLFQNIDTDRNGLLSPAEFAALVPAPKFIDVSPEMSRFDINRDQIISLVEYRTATLANFDRMDIDKDGNLSSAELSNSTTPTPNEPSSR